LYKERKCNVLNVVYENNTAECLCTTSNAYSVQTRHWCRWVQSQHRLQGTRQLMANVPAKTAKHQPNCLNHRDPSHNKWHILYMQLTLSCCCCYHLANFSEVRQYWTSPPKVNKVYSW